jgi:hypothetical protein
MLVSRKLTIDGKVWGTILTFEKAGDVFPTHSHTDADNHITAVMFGSVRVVGHPRYEAKAIEAQAGGTIIKWKAGEPHGFIALTGGATIMNLVTARS